ncbi:IpaD/SipD/SspD family type III secretion system needle tip protein [Candidatus Symbiopectobacterium sp. NZEC135]|uniref:IpaD/SipD/SspD family type III secretion system needle tip protein n=1 Tax=Candidatus Symbiopectobacterium sp. NZEC135 TaxID=2820471 RepID=UPI0022280E0F|nr:IpaD/SipD/SspD family type III secretion system needle tip protein [Candidatus Symbiopectobacterium sp. NZEC135]MCW2478390.1 IpaD/SipD/SspD family type III secretion system needle tip protein [Candidatus Symbiopectobacterium sp. NZEC135]
MTISNVLLPVCAAIFPRGNTDAYTTVAHWQGASNVSDAYSQHDVKNILLFLITENKEGDKLIDRALSLCEMHGKMLSVEKMLAHLNINPNLASGGKLLQYVDEIRRSQQKNELSGESHDDIKSQLTASQCAIQTQLNKIQQQIRDDKLRNKAAVVKSENLAYQAQNPVPDEEPEATLHRVRRSVENTSEPFTTSTSYAELWAEIAKVIANIKTNYVDFYGNLLQKYTEMYDEYNKNVQKAAADSTHSGKEANSVSFDEPHLRDAGYKVFNKWIEDNKLGSVPGWSVVTEDQKEGMTESQKEEIRATLAPAFKVDNDGKISFNKDTYDKVTLAHVTEDGSYTEVSSTRYQAWLASFNSVSSAFQSNMQSFAQRYSQANSTFDNLNKVLSSVISSLGESAREVLKALS